MQEAEVPPGRHQIYDLHNFELLNPQLDPLANLGTFIFVNDRAGMDPAAHDVTHFIDSGHRLAANEVLMAEFE